MKFTIRDMTTYEEMLQVHRLQQQIWGYEDRSKGLYPPALSTAAKNGGVVLGAFDAASDQLVAFLFGFLGREPGGPLKLCSQVMGVLPQWRGLGIGEALKQAQRDRVLAQDLPLITWTFDPLEGPNGHLNIHKLRAVSRRYLRNIYGSNLGALNAGLPSDRLLVEWWVQGSHLDRVGDSPELETEPIFEVAGSRETRYIIDAQLTLSAPRLSLETPTDIQTLKGADPDLARDWRFHVRQAFETYFAQGYITVDFVSGTEAGQRRNRYILQRGTPELLAEIGIEAD